MAARHLLSPPRALPAEPASVMRVMERLGSLQFDPLDIAGRNHDLVLASRIPGYRRAWTDDLLYRDRTLFEAYNKGLSIVPTAELPWYRVSWDRELITHGANAFQEHADLVVELLDRIRRDGPLSSTDVEPRAAIDWYWRPTNQVRALLEALAEAGILGISRRDGNRRIYDLAERLFPPALLAQTRPEREQRRHKLLSRYRANGLLGRTGSAELWLGTAPGVRKPDTRPELPLRSDLLAELVEAGDLVPVTVQGVRGERFVLREELPMLERAGSSASRGWDGSEDGDSCGVAFLAPLDPFVWDRDLLRALYDFDYVWEVYVPAAKRRWGYYVLPVLYGPDLVGRIEPRADRRAGLLRVTDIWWQDGFDPLANTGFVDAFADALDAHARFVGARRIAWPRLARHRALGAEVRARLGPGGRLRA
jgi:Uncharacterized protein conserved in bacteria